MKRFSPVFAMIILLICLMAACDMSGNILSPSEKDQLYSAEFRLLPPEQVTSADASAAYASQSGSKTPETSLSDGSSLKPGDSFSVTCKAQSPESLVSAILVTLASADADIASVLFMKSGSEAPVSLKAAVSQKLASVLDSPLPVSLPENLVPGTYLIKIGFFERNAQVFEKNLQIFVLSASPNVDSILVCPASVSPGSLALLQAKIGYPADSRLYAVWRFGSTVIGSGLVSDGFDQILWKSPGKEGVYGIKLFVYPFPPAGGLPYAFDSQVSSSAKVVAAVQPADPTDPFQDAAGFSSLLHFAGDFEDSGYRENARKTVASGQARASVIGVNFGYQLDSERSLSFDEYLLPVKQGRLGAFSLMGRFTVPNKTEGSLFRSESLEPGFSLSFGLDESGQYVLSLADRAQKVVSSSGIVADGQVHDVIVSLTPYENGYRAQWFLDYRAQAREELPILLSDLPSSGRASMGGQGATPAVYDEFGIYASAQTADSHSSGVDSPTGAWARAYSTLMAKTYRDSLILAEGFDGRDLPGNMETSGTAISDFGALLLGEASSLSIPITGAKDDTILIDMQLRSGSGKDYSFSIGPKGSSAVRIFADGAVQWTDGSGKGPAKTDALGGIAPSLKLEFSQDACILVSGKQRMELFPLSGKAPSVSLRLDSGAPVGLESLLVRRLSVLELLANQTVAARRVGAAYLKPAI